MSILSALKSSITTLVLLAVIAVPVRTAVGSFINNTDIINTIDNNTNTNTIDINNNTNTIDINNNTDINNSNVTVGDFDPPIPEPATLSLLAMSVLLVGRRRRA